jgi:T-complex protein 1 subunit delta
MRLVEGIVLKREEGGKHVKSAIVRRMERAKVALVQFQLSPPKTDLDASIVVSDYQQMDRILREERQFVLDLCKRLKRSNLTCLIVQKSILRDAVSDLARHYLDKLRIMIIEDVERDMVSFLSRALHIRPLADVQSLDYADKHEAQFYATCDLVDMPEDLDGAVALTGIHPLLSSSSSSSSSSSIKDRKSCATIVVRGSNQVVLEEAKRSLDDALGVLRCLHQQPRLVAGGGAPEVACSVALCRLQPSQAHLRLGFEAYAAALDIIPGILAENAGLFPLQVVNDLKAKHLAGNADPDKASSAWGVSVRQAGVGDMRLEGVVQPALVTSSALTLATETVCQLLKIDDIIEGQ